MLSTEAQVLSELLVANGLTISVAGLALVVLSLMPLLAYLVPLLILIAAI